MYTWAYCTKLNLLIGGQNCCAPIKTNFVLINLAIQLYCNVNVLTSTSKAADILKTSCPLQYNFIYLCPAGPSLA